MISNKGSSPDCEASSEMHTIDTPPTFSSTVAIVTINDISFLGKTNAKHNFNLISEDAYKLLESPLLTNSSIMASDSETSTLKSIKCFVVKLSLIIKFFKTLFIWFQILPRFSLQNQI